MYSLPVGKWITIANITICPSTVCTVYTSCIYHTTGARVKYIYICILNGHYFFISPHIIQNFFKHPPLNQRKKLQPQPAVLIRKIKYRRCKAPPIVQRSKELEFEFFDTRGRSTRMPCSSLNEKIIQKCRVVLFAQRYWDTIDHRWVHVYSPEASRGYKLLSNNSETIVFGKKKTANCTIYRNLYLIQCKFLSTKVAKKNVH